MALLPVGGRLFGDGPLAATLRRDSPAGLTWAGWSDSASLWRDASVFVGTSMREAFGRSAVEAAGTGLPIVISSAYGAAPLLFTDPDLRSRCVLDSSDAKAWASAIRQLLSDEGLRSAVSDHVYENAQSLTIDASVINAIQRIEHVRDNRGAVV